MPENRGKIGLTCFGTGLIALDLVTNGDKYGTPRAWAGGSCGNVLIILSYLGWTSSPVARLGDDSAAKAVAKDMATYGVDLKYLTFDKSINTPIIFQRIFTARDGLPTHRFYWICPSCGNWLPRYIPIRLQDISVLREQAPDMNCFYFDRISPAALRLAEMAKQKGALVIFEPTGIKNDPQFHKACSICDVLKFSNERSKNSPQHAHMSQAKLVVETLGVEGLKYRLRVNGKRDEWKFLPSFRVRNLKDAAGAGDWCTAGLIHFLASKKQPLDKISEQKIINALRYGQALSALNCSFEGARGTMYGIENSCFDEEVQLILDREESSVPDIDLLSEKTRELTQCICPACMEAQNKLSKPKVKT